MASTPITRAVLKTRIAQRANTSGYVNSEVGGELSQLVDTSLGKLHNLQAELYEDYAMARSHFAVAANQSVYPLPADFLKTRTVHYLTPSSSSPGDLSAASGARLEELDAAEYQEWGSNGTGTPRGFVIEGRNLILVPGPSQAGFYVGMKYIPQYVPAVSDETPIEFGIAFGWDDWVVNDVTIDIRLKAMMPTGDLVARNQAYEERLRIQAKNRNATQPKRVRNTGWRRGGGGRGSFSFT